jgi:hypothetical protein
MPRLPPYFALQLLQPLTFDLDQLTAPMSMAVPEWARLKFDRLPVGSISRWLQHRQNSGRSHRGESVLRSGVDGQITLVTTTPWQLSDATFAVEARKFWPATCG